MHLVELFFILGHWAQEAEGKNLLQLLPCSHAHQQETLAPYFDHSLTQLATFQIQQASGHE
jgi:hypothetical protein